MTVIRQQRISISSCLSWDLATYSCQTTYSYVADHPENVSKLVHMDFPFPGFFPPEFGENGPWWWFTFQQVRGLPVLEGKEQEYYHGF